MRPWNRWYKITAFVILAQIVCGPLAAQSTQGGFDRLRRPWETVDDGSSLSFRRDTTDTLRQQVLPNSDREALVPQDIRGKLLSEPTLSGVTYQVHVVGEVANPGTYRITASDRLQEVLQRAGGTSTGGSMRNVQIRRKGSAVRSYDLLHFQLYGALDNNPYLLDNDVVHVPLRKTAVQVVGSVRRPQIYEVKNERTLAQIITLAGGFTVGVANDTPLRLIRFVDGKKTVFEINRDSQEMEHTIIENGDVIYAPNVLTADRNFDYSIARIPGDQTFYPSYEDRIFVLGGVNSPGPYPFNPYATVNQYLTMAGGTTKLARVGRLQIISMDGKKQRLRLNDTASINPGDTIYVPEPRIPPEGWIGIVTGLAGFGLSTTATVLSLSR